MRFLGNIEAKIDAKGRAFLPAAFRKELQQDGCESLVVRKDIFQPCLVVYPECVWNAHLDMLRMRMNRWDSRHQQVFRQFMADAEVVTLDATGRFPLSRRLIAAAAIDHSIRFIGMDDTIEIWSSRNTETPFMEAGEFGKALEGIMRQDDGIG